MQEGKTALIVGMGGKRDAAFARALAAQKMSVELLVHGGRLSDLQADLRADLGEGVTVSGLDLTEEEEIRNAVQSIVARRGKIDCLINCPDFPLRGALPDITEKEWDDCVALNLSAVFMICKHVAAAMIDRRAGAIVNVTSDAAKMGAANGAAYAVAKAGLIAFSKSLAREVAGYGVRVNVISAGMMDGETTTLGADADVGDILLKRAGTWEEAAHLAACFLEDRSSYLTGQTVHVNGGLYMP
jgi:NAD(P)-dependent dehydrogenase (short-subunit alcohol dehydrogenase family)